MNDGELAAALQAMNEYYVQFARYHRKYRWSIALNDELRTELAFTRQQTARLAERVVQLEEILAETLQRNVPT